MVYGYDSNDTLVLTGKTLLDSSMEVSVSQQEIRAGKGNPLIFQYFHSGKLSISLTDAQFNLGFLAQAVGSSVTNGSNVWTTEDVVLGALGAGTVTGTPLALPSTHVYGWVTLATGSERVEFTGSNFTCTGTEGSTVCVRYYALDSSARSITIPSNILPDTIRLVLEADLNSGDQAGSNKIGRIQIEVPKAQLSGGFSLQMKADGVASTPLSCMALADEDLTNLACSSSSIFAKITEVLTSANWYDNLVGISVQGGNFGITSATSPKTLVVYGVKNDGSAPFIIPNAELSFTSATAGVATVTLHGGVVTRIGNGTSVLTVVVDDLNTVETQCTVTCS